MSDANVCTTNKLDKSIIKFLFFGVFHNFASIINTI